MDLAKKAWRKWLRVGHVIGNFQAQVILGAFYFLIVWPLGLPYRFLADPLRLKIKRKKTNFQKWQHPKGGLPEARKQY